MRLLNRSAYVVRIFDAGEYRTDELVWGRAILMEKAGWDLNQFLNEHDVSQLQFIVFVHDLLAALADLHGAGIVHCYLKQNNVPALWSSC